MAKDAGLLKNRADNLLKQAVNSLEHAQKDDFATKQQKREIEKEIA